MKRIFVGNLSYNSKEEGVRDLFSQFGEVHSVRFINDRETGKFRGFGFVEMEDAQANEAIEKLNDYNFEGRMIRVNEATEREKEQRERRPRRYSHNSTYSMDKEDYPGEMREDGTFCANEEFNEFGFRIEK